jgi:hypothetical protein
MAVVETILFWLVCLALGVFVMGVFAWVAFLVLQSLLNRKSAAPSAITSTPDTPLAPAQRLNAVMGKVSDLASQPLPAPAPPPPSVTDHHPALKQALMETLTDTVLKLPVALDRKALLLQEAGTFIEKLFLPDPPKVDPVPAKT